MKNLLIVGFMDEMEKLAVSAEYIAKKALSSSKTPLHAYERLKEIGNKIQLRGKGKQYKGFEGLSRWKKNVGNQINTAKAAGEALKRFVNPK